MVRGENIGDMKEPEYISKIEKSIEHAISILVQRLEEQADNKSLTAKSYTQTFSEAEMLLGQIMSLQSTLNKYKSSVVKENE